jgi:hypothetical protein
VKDAKNVLQKQIIEKTKIIDNLKEIEQELKKKTPI